MESVRGRSGVRGEATGLTAQAGKAASMEALAWAADALFVAVWATAKVTIDAMAMGSRLVKRILKVGISSLPV